MKLFTRVDDSLFPLLNSFNPEGNVFLSSAYLKTLFEAMNAQAARAYLAVFYKNELPLGLATFYLSEVHYHRIAPNLNAFLRMGQRLAALMIQWLFGRGGYMVVCGNPFTTQHCGMAFGPQVSTAEKAEMIKSAAWYIMKKSSCGINKLNALLVKDFFFTHTALLNEFRQRGYTAFCGDHAMCMPLHPLWRSMTDYVAALSSKYRTRYHNVMRKSAELQVMEINEEQMKQLAPVLEALYERVYNRVSFRLGTLPFHILLELKKSLGETMPVRVLMMGDTAVGFLTAFVNGHELDAHMIGFDEELNKSIPVYHRILFEYVNLALSRNCNSISFGRTAGEIKSTIGAVPVEAMCVIRSRVWWKDVLFRAIFKGVRPAPFIPREPFKKDIAVELHSVNGLTNFKPNP